LGTYLSTELWPFRTISDALLTKIVGCFAATFNRLDSYSHAVAPTSGASGPCSSARTYDICRGQSAFSLSSWYSAGRGPKHKLTLVSLGHLLTILICQFV